MSEFRSSVVPMWQNPSDAVVEYSRDIGMLVVNICIPKVKCNCVDLTVAGLMRFFFFLWKYYFAFCLLLNVLQLSSKSRMIFQLMQFWHVTDWNLLHKTSAGGCSGCHSCWAQQPSPALVPKEQSRFCSEWGAVPSWELPGGSWDPLELFPLYWLHSWCCSAVQIPVGIWTVPNYPDWVSTSSIPEVPNAQGVTGGQSWLKCHLCNAGMSLQVNHCLDVHRDRDCSKWSWPAGIVSAVGCLTS